MKVMEKLEPSDFAALETSLAVHEKIKCRSTVYSPLPFLGIYPEELKLCTRTVYKCTKMSTAALFLISQKVVIT